MIWKLRIRALWLLLAWAAAAMLSGHAQEDASAIIQARTGQLRNGAEVKIGNASIASIVVLPDFYERREFQPAWTDPANLDALLRALREIEADGLNPRDYHVAALEALRAADSSAQRDADLDMLATDALVRAAYHLRFGKVDVERIDPNWNFRRDLEGVLQASPEGAIEQAIEQRRVAQALEVLRPAQPIYAMSRAALAAYRRIADQGGWQRLPAGKPIKPGDSDPRLPALRERLRIEGDLEAVPADAGTEYDALTQTAVQRFQDRHGMHPDAVVGGKTLRTLNLPVQSKVDRLRLALERGRLILHDLPERFVVVNVPAYRLYYSDGLGDWFATNVVVGKMIAQTPIFRAEMTHVVLNPTWTVPPGIIQRDVIPGMRRDPDYLRKHGLKQIGNQYVQDAGPDNALGRIKLMFPNSHLVYLHDTPRQDLFEAETRLFSSGCIRVQNVFDLAERVIGDPAWTKAALLQAVETGKTRTINLKPRVAVLLAYWTAAAGADGRTYFYEDVYRRDAAELAALDAPFRFPARVTRTALTISGAQRARAPAR
jgi:murein L,D-transpeptidase YcbB/YkuD